MDRRYRRLLSSIMYVKMNRWANSESKNSVFYLDVFLALSIISIPFLIYLHLLFPAIESSELVLFGMEFQHGYYDNQTFVWLVLTGIVPILLISIYFLAAKGFSKYGLLLLISFFYFDFVSSVAKQNLLFSLVNLKAIIGLVGYLVLLIYLDRRIQKVVKDQLSIPLPKILKEIEGKKYERINKTAKTLINNEKSSSQNHYLCKVYRVLEVLNNDEEFKANKFSNYHQKEVLSRGLLTISILVASLLIVIWNYIPFNIDKITLLGFDFPSFGFESIKVFVWYLGAKVAIILISLIQFFNSNKWWKFAYLAPVMIYLYQVFEILFLDSIIIESFGNVNILPFVFLTIWVVILFSFSVKRILQAEYYREILKSKFEEVIYKEALGK
ncbi:hypothetical protein OZ410_11685 [Robiginitalea sp. M366]|uniref:hypothetical protein n=1 Tax=Robiginitalea aestuariiviva TaxID=3036903 RepID=UPI00240D95CD|nr:hypothetical protein [Robiginitalea aestuariiviva]MDG1572980.1 hypothetical protein [Robiginitalea aestuariiviva]